MKKNVLLFWAFLLLTAFFQEGFAQHFEWLRVQPVTYSLNPQMVRYTVTSDAAGNVLQAGLLTYRSNTSPGMSGEVMLRKYDRQGNPIFQQTLTGNAVVRHLAAYPNGDFLVAGAFRDSVVFAPGQKLTGNSTSQYFLAKLSGSRQVLWLRNLITAVPAMRDLATVTIDPHGTLYAGFSGTNNLTFIKKFDAAGTELLTIQQVQVRTLSGIGVDAAGNVYATGSCIFPSASFGGLPVSNGGSIYNIYVAKYSPTGVTRWVRKVQDITCTDPELQITPAGNVYVAGELNGSFAFGTFTSQGKTAGTSDFFLTRLDSAGTFKWLREVPQVTTGYAHIGYSNFLAVDTSENAYLAGFMRNSINWGNGIQNTGYGNADLLVQKYDTAGTLQWSKHGGGASIDEGHSVTVNSFGEVYLAGISRGPITLDTIRYNGTTTNIFAVLTKVNPSTLISGQTEANQNVNLQLYPNPATQEVTVILPKKRDGNGTIELRNATGQLVKEITLKQENEGQIKLDLKGLPAGLYFVQMHQGKLFYQQKLLVE